MFAILQVNSSKLLFQCNIEDISNHCKNSLDTLLSASDRNVLILPTPWQHILMSPLIAFNSSLTLCIYVYIIMFIFYFNMAKILTNENKVIPVGR